MLSEEIRAQLAKRHAAGPSALRPRGALVASGGGVSISAPAEPAGFVDWLAGGQTCDNASGTHLRFRRPLAALWPRADEMVAAAAGGRTLGRPLEADLAALAEWLPGGTVFLDLETCGFAGSMVFLVGLVWHDGRLVLDQLLARTYAEERAMLETLWQIAAGQRVLVTFNGKSFDWPMVQQRSTRHQMGRDRRRHKHAPMGARRHRGDAMAGDTAPPQLAHCDLLHHARRRWKRVLPNCRLQTLERYVCGRVRRDDLPGALIPVAYHQFVRTGRADQLRDIIKHNAWDLVTLAQLACRLLASGTPAKWPSAKSA